MQLSSLLTFLALTLTLTTAHPVTEPSNDLTLGNENITEPAHELSKRSCYAIGEYWGDQRSEASKKLSIACSDKTFMTGCGPGSGNYSPFRSGELRLRCFNIGGGKRMNLELEYRGAAPTKRIEFRECYDGFAKQINKCGRGGKATYGVWFFSADPNRAVCD